jgi:hypothetical protein
MDIPTELFETCCTQSGFSASQKAVYFIMLPFLVHEVFTFYIKVFKNLDVQIHHQKVKYCDSFNPLTANVDCRRHAVGI